MKLDVHRTILVYLMAKGFVVLPKSTNEDRMANNIQLEGLQISQQDISQIDELGRQSFTKVCWDSKDVL